MTALSTAHFKMDGTLSATGGHDVVAGSTVVLQLEDSPALDVQRITYSQILKSKGAPDLTGLPATVSLPATAAVNVGTPGSGIHTWAIQGQANGGVDANGKIYPPYTFVRALSIRGVLSNTRKILPSEQGQYDAVNGWTGSLNDDEDALEALQVRMQTLRFSEGFSGSLATTITKQITSFPFDRSSWPTGGTVKFGITAFCSNAAQSATVELYDLTDGSSEVILNVPINTLTPTSFLSGALTLPNALKTYAINVVPSGGGPSDNVVVQYAKIIGTF